MAAKVTHLCCYYFKDICSPNGKDMCIVAGYVAGIYNEYVTHFLSDSLALYYTPWIPGTPAFQDPHWLLLPLSSVSQLS